MQNFSKPTLSQDVTQGLLETGARIVVTGASGWLGKIALEMLLDVFGVQAASRLNAFSNEKRIISLRDGSVIASHPLREIENLTHGRYIFLHFAFPGREKTVNTSLGRYVECVNGINTLMNRSMRRVETCGIVLSSSGAVYGGSCRRAPDLDRDPYGAMKLQDEKYYSNLAETLQVPLTIARIFNMSGPYINKCHSYALSSMLLDVLNGRPLEIRAAHSVIRSYMHAADIVEMALRAHLDRREPLSDPFDTVGESEIEIEELAYLIVDVLGCRGHPIVRPSRSSQVVDRYVGDPVLMRRLLAKYGMTVIPLRRQIEDTAQYLRNTIECRTLQ